MIFNNTPTGSGSNLKNSSGSSSIFINFSGLGRAWATSISGRVRPGLEIAARALL